MGQTTTLRVRRPGYIRVIGANQAGAVISGAAVVLRQHPTRTNNQVKALLT